MCVEITKMFWDSLSIGICKKASEKSINVNFHPLLKLKISRLSALKENDQFLNADLQLFSSFLQLCFPFAVFYAFDYRIMVCNSAFL